MNVLLYYALPALGWVLGQEDFTDFPTTRLVRMSEHRGVHSVYKKLRRALAHGHGDFLMAM